MLHVRRLILGLVSVAASIAPAAAQQPLALEIRSGQVTINAQNIPLRTILTEWGRVGGTNVVGADRVAGAPVTLELANVSERQALEILLRSTSGYMLGLRPAGATGVSIY